MLSATTYFNAALTATSSEPKYKLWAVLRNVAARTEGATATASSVYDTSFPAYGAIDGDVTHINFGSASAADNGIGEGGWKSGSAATSTAIATTSVWTSASTTNIKVMGGTATALGHITVAHSTTIYEQSFDTLTTGTIVGQDGWQDMGGAGAALAANDITTTAARFGSTFGWHIQGGGAGCIRTIAHSITLINGWQSIHFDLYQVGAGATFYVQVRSAAAAQYQCSFSYASVGRIATDSAGTGDTGFLQTTSTWTSYDIYFDRTTTASSPVYLFKDGQCIAKDICDLSLTDRLGFAVVQGAAPTPNYYIDNLRIGQGMFMSATAESVIDWGAGFPVGSTAELTFSGTAHKAYRIIDGAYYGLSNVNNNSPIQYNADNIALAQTFQSTEYAQIDNVFFYAFRQGAPVGNAWAEIRPMNGTSISSVILARSRSKLTSDAFTTVAQALDFDFPRPFIPATGVTYAVVFRADYATSGAVYISFGIDTTPGYAAGQTYKLTGAGNWTGVSSDMGFGLRTYNATETAYAYSNYDADLHLREDSTNSYHAQGFQTNEIVEIDHLHLWAKMATATTAFSTSARWFLEIHSDDGTGKPSNTVLARSLYNDPANVTWTGYNPVAFTFGSPFTTTANTQYHAVVKATYDLSSTNCLYLAADDSAAGYAGGQRCTGTDNRTPTWTATPTSDMCFAVMEEMAPFAEFAASYSTDGITYGSEQVITNNPRRLASMDSTKKVTWTGESKRYWKIKTQMYRRDTNWTFDPPNAPCVANLNVKALFHTAQDLTVDMGANRVIDRVEIYAHPSQHGVRQFQLLSGSTTASLATVTVIDPLTMESRMKGGGATISYDTATAVVTMTGDYAGINMTGQLTCNVIQVKVLNNDDEYARIMEVRAHRCVDWTSRLKGYPSVRQDSDPMFRRAKPKELTCKFSNTDNALSPFWPEGATGYQTNLPPYKMMLYSGYRSAPDWLLMGTFYTDKWTEDPGKADISYRGRDLAKMLDINLTISNKTNITMSDAVEYLFNAGGQPSMNLVMQPDPRVINYLAEDNPNLWELMKKIVEAMGFGSMAITNDGYCEIQTYGGSLFSVPSPSAAGAVNKRLVSNILYHDGYLYTTWYMYIPGAFSFQHHRYSLANNTWQQIGTIADSNWVYPLVTQQWTNIGSEIFHCCEYGATATGTSYEISKLSESANTLVTVAAIPHGTAQYWPGRAEGDSNPIMFGGIGHQGSVNPGLGGGVSTAHQLFEGNTLLTNCGVNQRRASVGAFLASINLSNYQMQFLTYSADSRISCINELLYDTTTNRWIAGITTKSSLGAMLFVWDRHAATFTSLCTLDTTVNSGTSLSIGGMAGAGTGTVYVNIAEIRNEYSGTPSVTACTCTANQYYSVDSESGSFTVHSIQAAPYPLYRARNLYLGGRAIAYSDGILLQSPTYNVEYSNTSQDIFSYDYVYDASGYPLGGSVKRGLIDNMCSFSHSSTNYIAFRSNENLVLYYVREQLYAGNVSDASVITISSDHAGILSGVNIEHGVERGESPGIINEVVVKASPWVIGSVETVWIAPSSLSYSINQVMRTQLERPATNLSVTVTGVGGAGTIAAIHATQPRIYVTGVPTAGSFYISGNVLTRAGKMVFIGTDAGSVSRYGRYAMEVDNDYITDHDSQSIIAQTILQRYKYPRPIIQHVTLSVIIPTMEIGDKVRVIDKRCGLDHYYYVAALAHDFGAHKTTLDLVGTASPQEGIE